MIDISALDRATDSDEGNDHTCAFVVDACADADMATLLAGFMM